MVYKKPTKKADVGATGAGVAFMDIVARVKDSDDNTKLDFLWSSLSQQEMKLVKAIATNNPEFITSRRSLGGTDPKWCMELDDVRDYVDMAITNPGRLVEKEDEMLAQISRESDKFPGESHLIVGRRARYRVARLNLHEKTNAMFDTPLQILHREQEIRAKQSNL